MTIHGVSCRVKESRRSARGHTKRPCGKLRPPLDGKAPLHRHRGSHRSREDHARRGASPTELGGRLVLEVGGGEPLSRRASTRTRKKRAFQTQVFFLLSRFQQQQELFQQDLFSQVTVADYLFAKDRIFAALTLDPNELALYERVWQVMGTRVVKPDLVVYLQARLDVLQARDPQAGPGFRAPPGRHLPGGALPGLRRLLLSLRGDAVARGEHERPRPLGRGGPRRARHPRSAATARGGSTTTRRATSPEPRQGRGTMALEAHPGVDSTRSTDGRDPETGPHRRRRSCPARPPRRSG